MSAKAFAEKYAKEWKQAAFTGNVTEFRKLFDPAFKYHDVVVETNLDGYLSHLADIHKSADILEYDIKCMIAEGSFVGLDFRSKYKFSADIPGKPSIAGKEVTARYFIFLHIKDGKVDESWSAGTATEK
jgi:predicted ester cyclase